jgi:hypothetical protein
MRKLIWCCMAAMLVMAVGIGMTAQYAWEHQGSWAGRCVHAAWCVAIDWNPVVQVGRMVGQKSASAMRPANSECCVQTPAPCQSADPGLDQTMPPVIDVIDLGTLQGLTVQPEQEAMMEPTPEAEMVPAGAIEESEPQQEMPPADDEADKVPTAESGVDYWLGLFRDGGEEPAQIEQIPMPTEEGQPTPIDSDVTIEVTADSAEGAEPEPELLPMPHEEEAADGALKQTGATEESDKPGVAPDCKEDPNAAQHYPGCPYNGACPKQHCPAADDKEPGKAETDTMDFRSTEDAKPGEFEPKPME